MEIISIYIVISMIYGYSFLTKKSNTFVYFIFFFFLFVIAAFRSEGVDNDYGLYKKFYNEVDVYWGFVEFSYSLISNIVHSLFDDFRFVIIIYATISLSLMSFALKRMSHFPLISLMIYTGSYFLLHNMTQIRVACACAIFVLSLPYLIEGSKIKYLLLTLCATFFHYSSVAMLVLLFFDNKPITKRKQIILLILPIFAIVISNFFNLISLLRLIPFSYIQYKVDGYLFLMDNQIGGHDYINVFNSLFIVKLFLYSVLVIKAPYFSSRCSEFPLLIKIYTVSIMSLPAFAVIPAFATRYNEFFGIVEIFLFPLFVYYVKPYKVSLTLLLLFSLVVSYIYVFHNQFFRFVF